MKSIFPDKQSKPSEADLKRELQDTFAVWQALVEFTKKSFPGAREEWKFQGEKYGWSFRISDKKRVLIYILPRAGFFKAAFVFGQKATNDILESSVSDRIKNELRNAKVYAEGRGFRIEVRDQSALLLNNLKKLITIKIAR